MTNNINQHIEPFIVNPEVVVSDEPIVRLNQEYMETLKERARKNPRRPGENDPSLCSVFLHNLLDKANEFKRNS